MHSPRQVPVEIRRRRVVRNQAVTPIPVFIKPRGNVPVEPKPETEHEKVYRLVGERKFEEAARIAARLINAGNAGDFFVYNGTLASRRAQGWFDDRVADGIALQEPVEITPEIAQVLLKSNPGNRNIKVPELTGLMRDIAEGRWEVNGETIIVSSDGNLNDGQHRCFSALLSGLAIRSFMAFGVERDSRYTVDTGGKRTDADRLGIAGVPSYARVSAISAFAFELSNGRKPSSAESNAYFWRNQALIEAANGAIVTSKGMGPAMCGAAAMHLISDGYDPTEIKDFFRHVVSGENMSKRDPRMVLCKALFRERVKETRQKWTSAFVTHFLQMKAGKSVASPMFNETFDWKL